MKTSILIASVVVQLSCGKRDETPQIPPSPLNRIIASTGPLKTSSFIGSIILFLTMILMVPLSTKINGFTELMELREGVQLLIKNK